MKKTLITLTLILCLFTTGVSASTHSKYTNKDYETNERLEDTLVINGIDVSHFQSTESNWKSVKKDDIDFVIMRVTLTLAGSGKFEKDDEFEEHFKKSGDAGLMRGVYVFSQAKSGEEGKAEAEFAIKRLEELNITPDDLDLPIFMDYEFFHKEDSRLYDLSPGAAKEAAEAFCKTVQEHGYQAGVYANTSFFGDYLDNGETLPEDTVIWCAQYNEKNESDSKYTIWQYSSEGIVEDVYENGSDKLDGVDVDFWFMNKEINENPTVEIVGDTNVLYTGEPVLPELILYDGSDKLEEGKDYIIKGINNIYEDSEAYVFIRGIGEYKGYAIVPINIKKKFIKLPLPVSIIETKYDIRDNFVNDVPDGITVKELLKKVKLNQEDYRLSVVNFRGVELYDDDVVGIADMLGVFKGNSLVGTIDIGLKNETKINNIEKK